MSISSEAKQEVERLLHSGQKLNAMKYLADTFSVSLEEAEKLVEAVEREIADKTSVNTESSSGDLRSTVIRLLQENKKIEAVKLVKEQQNVGLKQALERVEEIQQEVNPYAVRSSAGGCVKKGVRIISVLFGFIGFILIGIAALIYYLQEGSIKKTETVEGTVVELVQNSDGGGTYAPVITYTWNSTEHRYTGTLYSNPPAFEIDEHVNVLVNTENPDEIVIDTFSERWLAITILGGIGGVFIFFSLIAFFSSRKF